MIYPKFDVEVIKRFRELEEEAIQRGYITRKEVETIRKGIERLKEDLVKVKC